MSLPGRFLDSPSWWSCHLHEAVARGAAERFVPSDLLNKAFGTTDDRSSRFWKETLSLDDEHGYWPQVHIGLPGGHVVSIIYFGNPRYDVEYRYCTPEGDSYLLAVEGPNFMLPGFRWQEVRAIASMAPRLGPMALLLLLPAASLSVGEEADARSEIEKAISELGFSSRACSHLASTLAQGLRHADEYWSFDEGLGWVSVDEHCWRCPARPARGLIGLSQDGFSALKRLTGALGVNPSPR
jgi:hypothetical protein